jgi:hypothetical protein
MKIYRPSPRTTFDELLIRSDSNPDKVISSSEGQSKPKNKTNLAWKITNISFVGISLGIVTILSPELGMALAGLFVMDPDKIL